MARTTLKAVVSVELDNATTVEGQTTAERNEQLKQSASLRILDALTHAEMHPALLRIRIARAEKEAKGNE